MEETSRRGILGWYWSFDSKGDWHSIRHDRNAIIFKGHFQLIVFQKLKDWKLERYCMKNDIFSSTTTKDLITIRSRLDQRGMMNWALQLNNSQSVNSFNSLLEKHHVLSFPNQPNPNPIQTVIDRGNLIALKMCLLFKGETSRSHEIDEKRVCTKNLVLQIDRKDLIICLKTLVLRKLTIDQGNFLNDTAQVHTQWKNNLLLMKIVTLRHSTPDNEFNRAINEGEHRLQHSRITTFCSETITWRKRSKFVSEDLEPPSSTCTSKWSSTTSTIQYFQQRVTIRD